MKPTYRKPTRRQIEEALEDAFPGQEGEYRVVAVRVSRTQGADDIELDDEQASLVDAFKKSPAKIPPIVVEDLGGYYAVVDGYHRLDAAKRAGIEWIWGVVAD